MKNIVYLLGAGASANELPMVKQIPDSIKSVIEILGNKLEKDDLYNPPHFSDAQISINDVLASLIREMKHLMEKCKTHASIDTYAKKIFLTKPSNSKEISELKNVFSVYFTIEQIIKGVDYRYDAFWASIFSNSVKLPNNIKILSWNYDFQLEKSLSVYTNEESILSNKEKIKSASKNERNDDITDYQTFKLNGTASVVSDGSANSRGYYNQFTNELSDDVLIQILTQYYSVKYSYSRNTNGRDYSSLSFAWESSYFNSENVVNLAKKQTMNCNILVVIGYSFPFFNRNVDRMLFDKEAMPNLEKIYFQSPNASEIMQSFQSIRLNDSKVEIVPIVWTEQFFLPHEL